MKPDTNQLLIAELLKHARAKRINRREFMSSSIAVGLTLSSASSLFSTKVMAQSPKKGGVLRVGLGHGATTDSLDPANYESDFMFSVTYSIHNNLAEIDNQGNLAPELAESWEPADAGKKWRFKLRQGVVFHDGKLLDTEDVIASINYHRTEDSTSSAKSLLKSVVEITSDGPDTVVFTLDSANVEFPYTLSDVHLAIKPAKDGKIDPTSPVGTGGYILKDFQPGVRASFERNPNYWKQGAAHFDGIELLSIIDASARINALRSGDIDVMDRVDLKTASLLERVPNINVNSVEGWQHYSIPMRTDMAPFNDFNVRNALKFALDRQVMVDTILHGHGSVGNDHPVASVNPYYNAELPQRSYDPEKAKWHLKQAGLSSLKVDLSSADAAFGGAVDAATLYREQAMKAGIDINIVREPNDGYWSDVWLKKAWCFSYWYGLPALSDLFTLVYSQGAAWNETFWDNKEFNQLLVKVRAESDDENRKQIYSQMQQILSDDGGALIPMFANYLFATTDKVKHGKLANNWDKDGIKFMERWWFDS